MLGLRRPVWLAKVRYMIIGQPSLRERARALAQMRARAQAFRSSGHWPLMNVSWYLSFSSWYHLPVSHQAVEEKARVYVHESIWNKCFCWVLLLACDEAHIETLYKCFTSCFVFWYVGGCRPAQLVIEFWIAKHFHLIKLSQLFQRFLDFFTWPSLI